VAPKPGFALRVGAILAVAGTLIAAPGHAQDAEDDAAQIGLELNKLEPQADSCRAYMVVKNTTPHRLEAYALDLVIFDTEEVIANRLRVRLEDLRANKTVVRLFDIPKTRCESVGRLLLNKIATCELAGGGAVDCLDLTRTRSRAGADFVK